MEFKFEGRAKLITQVLMAVGLIALVGGYLTDHSDHHQRWWANLLVNGFFYFSPFFEDQIDLRKARKI